MTAGDRGGQGPRTDEAGPADPARAHAHDLDPAGANVIDLRPYLTRAAAPPQRPEEVAANDEGAGPPPGEAVADHLCAVIVAGKILYRAEQLPELIERLRAECSAAHDFSDDGEA